MVPAILQVHQEFLNDLRQRLDSWDKLQQVGDAFVGVVLYRDYRKCRIYKFDGLFFVSSFQNIPFW